MSYLSWTTKWNSIVLMGESLVPNEFEMIINFDPNNDDADQQEVAFERMRFIINGIMNNSILANVDNPLSAKLHNDYKSMVVTLPGEPGDQLLGYVLMCKLNSVLDNVAVVEGLSISSRLGDNVRNWADSEDVPHLPFLHDNRIKDLTGDQPWWFRSDAGCSDVVIATKKKITVIKDQMLWEEIDLGWQPKPKKKVDSEPAQVINFPGWKPKVIQGGKER